jgi:predicted nucleic acid-binding protein
VSGFILDCSVAVAWCIDDEATPESDALLDRARDEGAIVPQLWPLELGNVLLQASKRGRLSAKDVTARLDLISELPIRIDEETAARGLREVIALARTENLTTYDATYLELAMRRDLPLASRDDALAEAAHRNGIRLLLLKS